MKLFSSLLLLACALPLLAKDPALPGTVYDFTKGDKLPAQSSHDWTLGPIGARGWCQVSARGAEGTTRDSRQILITKVNPKGPAKKHLKKGDVILGVEGTPFESDARIAFALAISRAESSSEGLLSLERFREGTIETINITLLSLPAFTATAPFECPKSATILSDGCDAMVVRGVGRPAIASHINALALLATGDRAYEDAIEDHVERTLKNPLPPTIGLACWHFSFANMMLCEYYLITKDRDVLPEIRRLSGHLIKGQGPLGTWGHTFVNPATNRLQGYGAVNAVGLPTAISLALARECDENIDGIDDCLDLAASFFHRHVGLGAIPYGDGPPNLEFGHDDNGKNSAAALFFNLINDQTAARYFTRSALASYGADREQGHTGNFLNVFWSLPAVSLAGPMASGAWLSEFGWYYDLARDSEYRFPYQGYPRQRAGNAYANWNCPGAYLLHFALPLKKLRITGREMPLVKLTPAEISESIEAGKINYQYASVDFLRESLSSWSPIVRKKSASELRRRKKSLDSDATLTSSNPLKRIAALRASNDFNKNAKLLADEDIQVQMAAIQRLAGQNKQKAVGAIFEHLARKGTEQPLFTQAIGNHFFPLTISAVASGKLLNAPKDRKATIAAINILLSDEDALVSSRIATGLRFLPDKELYPLLPRIYEQASQIPVGNVMFSNKLRTSCAEVLAHLNLEEGAEASAALLADDGWGRNSRLPAAARLVVKYKGHSQAHLKPIEEALKKMKAGGTDNQWTKLLADTIEIVKAEPAPKDKLKTIADLTK